MKDCFPGALEARRRVAADLQSGLFHGEDGVVIHLRACGGRVLGRGHDHLDLVRLSGREPVVRPDHLARLLHGGVQIDGADYRAVDLDLRDSTPSAAPVLEVRRSFETNRLGAACLAAAYAQIVPRHQRRAGVKLVSGAPAATDPRWSRAVGVRGGIRDV